MVPHMISFLKRFVRPAPPSAPSAPSEFRLTRADMTRHIVAEYGELLEGFFETHQIGSEEKVRFYIDLCPGELRYYAHESKRLDNGCDHDWQWVGCTLADEFHCSKCGLYTGG